MMRQRIVVQPWCPGHKLNNIVSFVELVQRCRYHHQPMGCPTVYHSKFSLAPNVLCKVILTQIIGQLFDPVILTQLFWCLYPGSIKGESFERHIEYF